MFYKTMGITCDDCGTKTECREHDATRHRIIAQARREGWSISAAGHFCPDHRQRKAKQ